jgi:hypothetical protein
MTMNVRKLATKALLVAAVAVGTLPVAAVQAFAGGNGNGNLNGGCGSGYTEATLGELAQYAADTYGGAPSDYNFSGLDKNKDLSLCYHPTGRLCTCGANAINVVDDNANATFE